MRVYGIEVSQVSIDAAMARMSSGIFFTARDIADVMQPLKSGPLGHSGHMRAADRLLQRERRAGNIEFSTRRGMWALTAVGTQRILEAAGVGKT